MNRDRHEVLAQHVRERMDALGFTLESLADHSEAIDANGRGLSSRTLSHMRAGTGPSYHARTRTLLERCMGWAPGSVTKILDGGADAPRMEDDFDDVSMRVLAEQVSDLTKRLDRITEALGRALGGGQP